MILSLKEWKWQWGFSLVVLVLTTLPYLLGFWLQGSDWRFTGFFIGLEDGNSYIAKMSIGTYGGWLFQTPYTAFPQNGFLAFLPYILIGKLAYGAGLHDQLVGLFQAFRWSGAILMILATYQFAAFFLEDPRWRKFATGVATLGGGLGWLAFTGLQGIWGGRIPLEVYSPESFGFLSLFTLPHLAAARGLLLLGLVGYWRSYSAPPHLGKTLSTGLIWLILGLMQPLTVLIGWMVIGLDLAARLIAHRRRWAPVGQWRSGLASAAALVLFSAPVAGYNVISFLADPFLKLWSQQNIIQSPPPLDYLMAYGFLLPWIILGFRKMIMDRRIEGLTLLAWGALLPVLAYFPINLQRRLPEGIWPVLVLISVVGICSLAKKWQRAGQVVLSTTFVTTIFLVVGAILTVLPVKSPIYLPVEEVQAFQAIPIVNGEYPVVLASFDTSNALPAWSPVRTLIGHGPESIHLNEIQPRVERFFDETTTDETRLALISEFQIRYIFWGPEERRLGTWDPTQFKGLVKIFENPNYQVFKVEK